MNGSSCVSTLPLFSLSEGPSLQCLVLSLSEQGIANIAGLRCQPAGSFPMRLSETVPCTVRTQPLHCLLLLCHSVLPSSLGLPVPLPSVAGLQNQCPVAGVPLSELSAGLFSLLSSSLCSGKSDEQLPCCHCLVAWHKGFNVSTSLWDCQPAFSRNSPRRSLGTMTSEENRVVSKVVGESKKCFS